MAESHITERSWMSTPVFVDPEISTQADEAQSSRVPVPLPEDPYEAIRQAYLDGVWTLTPPISLHESTPPTLVPILRGRRMAVRVPLRCHRASLQYGRRWQEACLSPVRKRFRSSRESSPSLSPLDLPSRKRYRGTSEFVEDSEEDDDEEDEEIEESLDSDSVSEDAEDEGPTAEDEDSLRRGECLACVPDEGLVIDDGVMVLDDESPPLTTWTDPEDGMVYIDVSAYPPPAPPVQTTPSPEWTAGLLPISPSPSIVLSLFHSPMILIDVPSLYDMHGENRDLRLQLAEERRARLDLAEVVDNIRRGQEPKGDA
ncbi:hypothetical protein Tco_0599922 [Tanacetum coccineum]